MTKKFHPEERIRAAEEAVRLSERKWRALYDNMPDGLVSIGRDGRILGMNKAFRALTGYTAEELRRMTYLDLTPKKWHEMEKTMLEGQIRSRGHSSTYEKEYRKKDGTIVAVELRTFLSGDEAGSGECMWAVVRDVSARRRNEQALVRSEEKFARIFAGSPISLWLTTVRDMKLLDVNASFVRDTGFSREEALGRTSLELGLFPDAAGRERFIAGMEASGQVRDMHLTIRAKSGETRDMLFSGTAATIGGKPCYLVSAVDITERRRAEAALQQSEAFIKAVLDRLPVGVAVGSMGPPTTFIYMNDNFPGFCRTTREKLAAPDGFWDAVYEDPAFRERARKRVLEEGAAGDPERTLWTNVPITRAGEETTFVTMRNVPVPGRSVTISLVFDVTERIRNEESLKKRLRYEETLSFISSLAAAAADMDSFLNDVLRKLGTALDVSRVYIFEYRPETDKGDNTYEWTAPGISSQMADFQRVPAAGVTWLMERMRSNTAINCPDLGEVADERTRDLMACGGAVSVLIVPLLVGGDFFGFIGFDECRRRRDWPQEDVDLLSSISRIIAAAIERRRAEARLAEQLDELRRWQTVTLGRERRVLDLKREVNELLVRSGLPPRYASAEEEK
ncbi:MAG: PAS domain S-box protein [Acidobacteriota bacterium]